MISGRFCQDFLPVYIQAAIRRKEEKNLLRLRIFKANNSLFSIILLTFAPLYSKRVCLRNTRALCKPKTEWQKLHFSGIRSHKAGTNSQFDRSKRMSSPRCWSMLARMSSLNSCTNGSRDSQELLQPSAFKWILMFTNRRNHFKVATVGK